MTKTVNIGKYSVDVTYQPAPRKSSTKYKEGFRIKVLSARGTIEEFGFLSEEEALDRGLYLLKNSLEEKLSYIQEEKFRLTLEEEEIKALLQERL